MSRDSRQNGHKVVLDNGVRVTDSASEDLDEQLTPAGLLKLNVDELEGNAFRILDSGLVCLGKFRRHDAC
jgi:hypothetical protein